LTALAALMTTTLASGQALAYPSKAIRMVVPFSPGTGIDLLARMLAERMSERFAQPVIVDNRVGAGGIIGFSLVAKAPPDGYTLLVSIDTLILQPALRKVPYDPIRDFAPIMQLATSPLVLVVHPSVKVSSVKELVALTRANTGKFNYGTAGVGTFVHLATEHFKRLSGANLVHIPHKGITTALIGLAAGDVQVMLATPSIAMPYINAGQIVPLAITRRSPLVPNIPTFTEAGIRDFDTINPWFGLLAPAGTPKEIVSRLNAEVTHILSMPEMRSKLSQQGIDVAPGTPEQFAALLAADLALWRKVVEMGRIVPE
jgi:tripartite-type tricarboxylate transporter receptor subunit TctC